MKRQDTRDAVYRYIAKQMDGKTPTCIASQAVAIRSSYMPLWTDTFGVRKLART